MAPDEAFGIMRDVMRTSTEKIGRMLGKMTRIPGFKRFFLKGWDVMSHKMFGPTAGFSNVFYPTNPALLIGLSLADVNYGKWIKWSGPFQLMNLVLTALILLLGYWVGY